MDLHFYYDIVCPYAYIASTRVESLAAAAGATVHWHPVLLGGIYRSVDAPDQPSAMMPSSKARLNGLDMMRQAELAGVELSLNPTHPQRSVEAMRLLNAARGETRVRLTHALYRHYHVRGGALDREGLAPLAAEFGVDLALIDDPGVKQALYDQTAEAVAHGAFGVPTFVVDGQMWWGADRMDRVAEALGYVEPPRPPSTSAHRATLTVFHDMASPFSYLASTQAERIAKETGATLQWAPMLLGAVFKTIGTPMVPLAAMSDAKRRWMTRDLTDIAQRHGQTIRWPSAFPLNTVAALRVSLVDPGTIHALNRAAWVEDRNIGDPDVLVTVLDDAGFDGRSLLAATQDPAIKASLRASTERAIEVGVCGAPSFLVDDTTLFWGVDRLDMVRHACEGWRPQYG